MSLKPIKRVFEHINDVKDWTIEIVQIVTSKRTGTSYVGREIILEPQNKLNDLYLKMER